MTVGELLALLASYDPTMEVHVGLLRDTGFEVVPTSTPVLRVGELAPMDWVILETDVFLGAGPKK
jgi:hypothetical protein